MHIVHCISNLILLFLFQTGFDTHSNVEERLDELFVHANGAIEAFVSEMKAADMWNNVTLIQTSDFGRTLNPNGGDGTDHAWGKLLFYFIIIDGENIFILTIFETLSHHLLGGNYFMMGKFSIFVVKNFWCPPSLCLCFNHCIIHPNIFY